jgi:hypothetical protein
LSGNDDTAVPRYDTPLWKAVAKLASTIGEKLFQSLQTTRSEDPAFKDFEKRMESGGKLTESELRVLRGLGSPEQQYFPKTRALIRQKALDGHLTLWGKKQLDNLPEGFTQRQFSDVLTAIPPSYWAVSKISPSAAVENNFTNVPHTQPESRAAWPNERNSYADLHVGAAPSASTLTVVSSKKLARRPKKRKRTKNGVSNLVPKPRPLTKRESDMLVVIKLNLKGSEYFKKLTSGGFKPRTKWIKRGCPGVYYPGVFHNKTWRQATYGERSKLHNKSERLASSKNRTQRKPA